MDEQNQMTEIKTLKELESLVSAMEESLTIIVGTISATYPNPGLILKQLCGGKVSMNQQYGTNEWRDRLMRSPLKIAALKSREQATDDPELQDLISNVLGSRNTKDPSH